MAFKRLAPLAIAALAAFPIAGCTKTDKPLRPTLDATPKSDGVILGVSCGDFSKMNVDQTHINKNGLPVTPGASLSVWRDVNGKLSIYSNGSNRIINPDPRITPDIDAIKNGGTVKLRIDRIKITGLQPGNAGKAAFTIISPTRTGINGLAYGTMNTQSIVSSYNPAVEGYDPEVSIVASMPNGPTISFTGNQADFKNGKGYLEAASVDATDPVVKKVGEAKGAIVAAQAAVYDPFDGLTPTCASFVLRELTKSR